MSYQLGKLKGDKILINTDAIDKYHPSENEICIRVNNELIEYEIDCTVVEDVQSKLDSATS